MDTLIIVVTPAADQTGRSQENLTGFLNGTPLVEVTLRPTGLRSFSPFPMNGFDVQVV